MDRKLRVGVLLDSESIPAWAYRMLERIQASNYAEIILLIKNEAPGPGPIGFFRKLRDNRPTLHPFRR